ncbi:hypothetical protein OAN95_05775 [Alphaproteobacteria bacterium]|nr:hypothetical protein [Alphaproteobacteria bacterium]
MRVIGHKSIEGSTDSLGFMHAKLVFTENGIEPATPINIPNDMRIFVHSGFKQHIDSKFSENELFEIECKEVDDFRQSPNACLYGAFASSAQGINGQISSVLITRSSFDPNLEIIANSRFKPTKPCALIFELDTSETPFIAAPFEPFNVSWDDKSRVWNASFRAYTSNKSFGSLKPSHLYKLNLSDVPDELYLCAEDTQQRHSNCLSFDIFNYMETIQTESVDFVDDGALLRMLDAALDKDHSLGRKKRRELLVQVENAKGFSTEHIGRIETMLGQIDTANENFEQFRLKFAPDVNPQLDLGGQQESLLKLKTDNDALTTQVKELKNNLAQIQMGMSTPSQEVPNEISEKMKEMEDELNNLRDLVTEETNIDQMRGRLQELDHMVESKQEEKSALESAVLDLKNKYNESTADFRKKAHEVLPFIEMLNASANVSTLNPTFFDEPDETESNFDNITELVNIIKERMSQQHYEVDYLTLAQAVFFQCESRFLCFYGAPGTGKTSFARALSNAVTGGGQYSLFQGVEKGWSTSEDLIGHKNPFVNQFIYNDDFFKKLHFHSEQKSPLSNWISIICDEGNLSPVEQYLAFLIGRDEEFTSRKDFDIQIDQHHFLIPRSLRLFFTMNFDFTTEAVSPRFIDRTPVITCDEIERLDTSFNSKSFISAPIDFTKMMAVYDQAIEKTDPAKVDFLEDMYEEFLPDPDANILPKSNRKLAIQQKYIRFMSHFDFEAEMIMDELLLSTRLTQISGRNESYRDELLQYEAKIKLLPKSSKHLGRIIKTGDDFESYSFFS